MLIKTQRLSSLKKTHIFLIYIMFYVLDVTFSKFLIYLLFPTTYFRAFKLVFFC